MKKILSVVLGILMAAVSFCGCGPKLNVIDDDYDVNLDVPYDVSGNLKIGITTIYTERWLIDSLIAEYNQVYPNVKITIDEIQGTYNNTLVGYWRAEQNTPGIMPDILVSNSTDMHAIVENGILLNLQKYINESVKAGLMDTKDFNQIAWKEGQKNFDGDQYLAPRSFDVVVTHLNETRFNEVFGSTPDSELPFKPIPGKKIPANGWTWNEFMATCAKLRTWYDKNGRENQFLVDSCFDWEPVFNAMLKSNGAEIIDDKGVPCVNTPQVLNTMKMMNECITKRYVAPMGGSVQANYAGGQGCMIFNSAYAKRFYTELANGKFDYNLTTFPLVTNSLETSYIGSGVGGYAIPSTSRYKDLAWTFIRFMLSKDGQNALAKGGMTTNPIRVDMSDPSTNEWGKTLKDKGVNMEAYTYGNERCTITDFYMKPKKLPIYSDLLSDVSIMINTGIGQGEAAMNKAIKTCQESLEYRISIGK